MAYTYCFCDADSTGIKRTYDGGNVAYAPFAEGNRDYAEYLASGAYVAPPAPPEPTAKEKLANVGLTVEELSTLLGL